MDKQELIGKSYRCYLDSLSKKGFLGIGRILDVDSFNASGCFALCRVRLIGNRTKTNIDCWVDIRPESPDYCKPAVLS